MRVSIYGLSLTGLYLHSIHCQYTTFDYIVVGAGPTGSMIATELAKKGFSTLLMEAGKDFMSPTITIPAFHLNTLETKEIQWDYWVKHYDEKTGLRQKVLYPKASGLGGCTLHNALIHSYPNGRDFRNMVQLTGDPSWGESTFRKYYDSILIHGNKWGSPSNRRFLPTSSLNLIRVMDTQPKLAKLVKITSESVFGSLMGFDPNGYDMFGRLNSDKEGGYFVESNIDVSGKNYPVRRGIYEYLKTGGKSPNLTIWTSTLVTKVIMYGQTAHGVEFIQGDHLYRASPIARKENKPSPTPQFVYAKKEVILSAGAFNSPQIAMLSGIGDSTHLISKGITPIVHLPGVGKSLHDRYEISVNFELDEGLSYTKDCGFGFKPISEDPCYLKYLNHGTGPYTITGYLTAVNFKSSPDLLEADNVHLNFPLDFTGYHPGVPMDAAKNPKMFTYLNLKGHTRNRAGVLKLETNDPRDPPYINFHYFEQGGDKDLMAIIASIHNIRSIMTKSGLTYKEVRPGANVTADADLAEYIKNTAWGHHACGTMKIGQANDTMAVLDGNFRVKGVKNLRVADLSVMPNLPGYFPVLFLYLLGIKAADAIASQNQ